LRARLTGVGYYVRGLASALVEEHADLTLDSFDGIRFTSLASSLKAHNPERSHSTSLNAELALYDAVRRWRPMRSVLRQLKMAKFKRIDPATDVFHALNYMPPARTSLASIPMIYDVSFVRYPAAHPPERLDWLNTHLANLHEHPLVNTISQFSADEIAEVYKYPRASIRVTPPGIDPAFLRSKQSSAEILLNGRKLTSGAYLLMVGTLEPRKNHGTMLKAYQALPKNLRLDFPLVVVGQYGWGENTVAQAQELRAEGSLILTDYLDQSQLRDLYSNARALAFPSLYEGFGLPIMEAMAGGIPVIASDIPVFREVGGGYVQYAAAEDHEAWVHALERALTTDAFHDPKNLEQARQEAASYTWKRTAALTRLMYEERLSH
jgi:alpha-1,3-rhamnosyl/mannosyltransferase